MVWVELTFEGDVSQQSAEAFLDRVSGYGQRFGLRFTGGAAHASDYPGTPLMLDVAIQELARSAGVSPQLVQEQLEQQAREQIAAAA
jgi:hypothetical protein